MALYKEIIQKNGIVTNYHRILYLSITINEQNSIAVASYLNKNAREEEKNNKNDEVFIASKTYETSYDESMSIEKAYNYLSSLPEFEGAKKI